MENNILKLTLPDNWNEINISTFQELSMIDTQDVIAKIVDVAAVLADADPEEIKKLSTSELAKIGDALSWTGDTPPAEFKHIIEIDGIEYSLVPKLSDLSVGEWIDLETFSEDVMKNLHLIMAILYRPLITALNDRDRFVEDYDAKTMPARAEIFKEKMMIGDVYGALFFFSIIGNLCIQNLKDYSTATTEKEIQKK